MWYGWWCIVVGWLVGRVGVLGGLRSGEVCSVGFVVCGVWLKFVSCRFWFVF